MRLVRLEAHSELHRLVLDDRVDLPKVLSNPNELHQLCFLSFLLLLFLLLLLRDRKAEHQRERGGSQRAEVLIPAAVSADAGAARPPEESCSDLHPAAHSAPSSSSPGPAAAQTCCSAPAPCKQPANQLRDKPPGPPGTEKLKEPRPADSFGWMQLCLYLYEQCCSNSSNNIPL